MERIGRGKRLILRENGGKCEGKEAGPFAVSLMNVKVIREAAGKAVLSLTLRDDMIIILKKYILLLSRRCLRTSFKGNLRFLNYFP